MTQELPDLTGELVALVREGRVATFIDRAWHIPTADLADVLADLTSAERTALRARLPPPLAERVSVVAARAARSGADLAGSLLTRDAVVVNDADTLAFALEAVRRQATSASELTEIYVVDVMRRLAGVLPITRLLLAQGETLVRDVMTPHPVRVGPGEDQAVVARVIRRYSLSSVPVVDDAGRLLGRVTLDAVRRVAVDEAAEDLLHFGGVSIRETADATWSVAIRSRLPWLYATLAPAFGAAAVVFFFKGTLLRLVTLAVWLPVVAGVSGNAGTQALAAAVRRLVLHPARAERFGARVLREAAIGVANGVAIGAVVALVAVLVGESWKLGVVVLLAMIGNLAVAGATGAATPIMLERIGRDPALASPVVVTALMDACGFALLLGLASWILR